MASTTTTAATNFTATVIANDDVISDLNGI
jgi:hypothetical protein